jgi:hypothetical protein
VVLTKFLETAARAPGAPGGAAGAAAAGAGVVDGDFVPLEASPAERCVCAVLATRLLKVVSQVSLPPPSPYCCPYPCLYCTLRRCLTRARAPSRAPRN